jgi:hypothetical protein
LYKLEIKGKASSKKRGHVQNKGKGKKGKREKGKRAW